MELLKVPTTHITFLGLLGIYNSDSLKINYTEVLKLFKCFGNFYFAS